MSQTDPRAVASRILSCMKFRVDQFGERIACTIVNLGEIEQAIVTALADAERRDMERAVKVAEQMKIQTCAIRNETAIIHELLLKVESRIEKVATLEKQIRAQAQAEQEG